MMDALTLTLDDLTDGACEASTAPVVGSRLIIDLETRSTADLRQCGVCVYAEHPTTAITHVGFKLDNRPAQIWRPISGDAMPDELAAAIDDTETVLVAHNAAFERILLAGRAGEGLFLPANVGDPARWDCTAARAAAVGLPRALEGACSAFGLPVQKDMQGHALMLRCCRPRSIDEEGNVVWWHDDAEKMARLDDYCLQDVEAEYLLDRSLPHLSEAERQVWEITEIMNDAGLTVDRSLLQRLLQMVRDAQAALDTRISELTGGAVPKASNAGALTQWLISKDVPITKGIGKDVVASLLAGNLDPLIRQVLEIRREGGGSSSRKYIAIERRMSADSRIRHALVYSGAPSTGRFSSAGAQLQNLPRPGVVNITAALNDLSNDSTAELSAHGPTLKVASELLRSVFVAPPDCWLVSADYSQIEARCLPWVSGATDVMQAFRDYDAGTGADIYKLAAAQIYQVPVDAVTSEQRQIGKVSVLALGYGGGMRAFQSMAKTYGVQVSDARAEDIKVAWRRANPRIVKLWRDLEAAAIEAVYRNGTVELPQGKLQFQRDERTLTLRLPSGRSIYYWDPKLKKSLTPWGAERWTVFYSSQDALTRKWCEFPGWGGLVSENTSQAIARDVLADAILRLHDAGMRPIMSVHDEVICEVRKARFPQPQDAADAVRKIMCIGAPWTDGLPLAASAVAGSRYQKG